MNISTSFRFFRHVGRSWIVLVLAWHAFASGSVRAGEGPVRIESVQEVIDVWRADQHLYVKGDVGVGDEQLEALEAWLVENGPHWIVVLMANAQEETWSSSDGRTFQSMEAVEVALGQGLSNRTGFGQWKHPTTEESDGCVLVMFLTERKMAYFASDAQDTRGLGESHWIDGLDRPAVRAMRDGGRISDAVRDTISAIERQLQLRITAKQRMIRNTLAGASGLTALTLCGLLIWLNRRRAGVRSRAIAALTRQQTMVKQAMDDVLKLFHRSNEILGSSEKVEKRGYVGETDRLSDATFASIDDLLVMSNEVERVMGDARQLVFPDNLLRRLTNTFRATPFHQALHQIDGKPLVFHRDQGIPAILANPSNSPQSTDDETGLPATVNLTFDEVLSAFRQRCADANATLDELEEYLLTVNDALRSLQSQMEETISTDRMMHQAAEADGWFLIPSLFDVLLPSAQSDFDAADAIVLTDPVTALRKHVCSGQRKIDQANQVLDTIAQARRNLLPQLKENTKALTAMDYGTEWMESALTQLGDDANQLFALLAQQDAAESITRFQTQVESLKSDAQLCVRMAQQIDQTLRPALDSLREHILSGRKTMGERLRLRPDTMLREPSRCPDDHLAAASDNVSACSTSIQHGDATAAATAADHATTNLAIGNGIIDQSIAALDAFQPTYEKRTRRQEAIQQRIPKMKIRCDDAHRVFLDSALRFKSGDPSFPDANDNIDAALDDAIAMVDVIQSNRKQADAGFSKGEVLRAMRLLDEAEQAACTAFHRFEDIEEHLASATRQLEHVNITWQDALTRAESIRGELRDRRTARATIDRFDRVAGELERINQRMTVTDKQRDPFSDARPIQQFIEQLETMESHLQADRNAYEEAARALRGAEAQCATARRLTVQSKRDGIPDSRETTACVREIQDLEGTLSVAAKRLNLPHQPWKDVGAEAAKIHASLSLASSRLQNELESAQQLVESFRITSELVIQAAGWSGPLGVRIGGSPGSRELDRARTMLNQGDYRAVSGLIRAASQAAQTAIFQAEREVARRRRKQARAVEQARRHRREQRTISHPTFTSHRSSSHTPPSTGGFSSGSGFRRSGW